MPLLLSIRITHNSSQGSHIVNSPALERHCISRLHVPAAHKYFLLFVPSQSAEIPVELLGVKGMSWSYGPLLPLVRSREAAGFCHCPGAPSSAGAFGFTCFLGEQHLSCPYLRASPATGLKSQSFWMISQLLAGVTARAQASCHLHQLRSAPSSLGDAPVGSSAPYEVLPLLV